MQTRSSSVRIASLPHAIVLRAVQRLNVIQERVARLLVRLPLLACLIPIALLPLVAAAQSSSASAGPMQPLSYADAQSEGVFHGTAAELE